MNTLVLKFGGTSVKDAAAMQNVFSIINNDIPKIVVSSACSGITDALLALLNFAADKQTNLMYEKLDFIDNHHKKVIEDLFNSSDMYNQVMARYNELFNELKKYIESIHFLNEKTLKSIDKVVSYGEIFSTTILHFYCISQGINSIWLDARKFMKTDSNFTLANLQFDLSKSELQNQLDENIFDEIGLAITQGFIGSDLQNTTTTLGRGGSDYSASLIGKMINADEIQIWTDVDGILSADPRIVQDAHTIPQMEFNEVRQLAFFGAKVLHPSTLLPAIEQGIPIKVMNTFNPDNQGTTILTTIQDDSARLHSVVYLQTKRIEFPLASVNNFAAKSAEILQYFTYSKVYFTNIIPEGMSVWVDTKFNPRQVISDSTNFQEFAQINLIAITGKNINNELIDSINKLLIDKLASIIFISNRKNLVIIEQIEYKDIDLLQKINELIKQK
jgi:aspartate kinase